MQIDRAGQPSGIDAESGGFTFLCQRCAPDGVVEKSIVRRALERPISLLKVALACRQCDIRIALQINEAETTGCVYG
jgi:hypothetical protein